MLAGAGASASLDTRQQLGNGPRPGSENDRLEDLFRSAAERDATKRDLADVLVEISRRASERFDFARWRWFDGKAGALRDCTQVRVVPHARTGHGVARPISCHVRGCPDCERARVGRLLARHDEAAATASRPVFWTLTARNGRAGELGDRRRELARSFVRIRRRAIFRGGRCRWRWRERGPTGELDGAPGHPCHQPIPHPDCRPPRCAPACPAAGRRVATGHLAACDRGCPTRTGLHQSHCPTHRPRIVHPDGCPRVCPHAGHRRDRNCPDFRHEPVTAGIAAFDVTWSDGALAPWNVHLHMLLDAPWVGWAEMRDHWQAVTCRRSGCRHGWDPACEGSWMVWVVAVDRSDADRRHAAVREVLKYVGKPHGIVDSLDPDRVEEYLWALRGQRVVTGWGAWRAVQEDDDGPAEADSWRIRLGFSVVVVPRICPICHAVTEEADWGIPLWADRLAVTPLEGGLYGWRSPPARC